MPSQVWIGPVRFTIKRDGRSEIAAQVHDARAVTVTARASIELDPQLPASTAPVTVMHEILRSAVLCEKAVTSEIPTTDRRNDG